MTTKETHGTYEGVPETEESTDKEEMKLPGHKKSTYTRNYCLFIL